MVKPKIVYCDKNHIYDAATDKSCPYCRKIEEDYGRLNKSMHESKLICEYTELIKSKSDEEMDAYSEEDDDKTEMLVKVRKE